MVPRVRGNTRSIRQWECNKYPQARHVWAVSGVFPYSINDWDGPVIDHRRGGDKLKVGRGVGHSQSGFKYRDHARPQRGPRRRLLGTVAHDYGQTRCNQRRTKVTGWPALLRASMNALNGRAETCLEYIRFFRSGNSSIGDSPPLTRRERESSATS
jgi:hypothetical protein